MLLLAKPGYRVVYMGEAKLEKETQPGGIRLTVTGFDFNFGTVERVERQEGWAEAEDSFLYHLKGHERPVRAELCRVIGFNSADFEIIQNALRVYGTPGAGAGLTETERDAAKELAQQLKDFFYA